MKVDLIPLNSDDDWNALLADIHVYPQDPAANLLLHARDLGSVCALIESDYLDRDFSDEYSAFYSRLFKSFPKKCNRIHFFKINLSDVFEFDSFDENLEAFSAVDNQYYIGFIVVRPLSQAPIGRTVLAAPPNVDGFQSHLLVRSNYDVHLFNATFSVEGAPFIQQDSRIGACAHSAIWMASRHLHNRHSESWNTVPDIAEFASTPMDSTLSSSLPAGSGGLNVDNMLRALRSIGRKPLIYAKIKSYDSSNNVTFAWPAGLDPSEIINRYVDSAIPVIIGLTPWEDGQETAHAALVVGHTLKKFDHRPALKDRPTRAEFCEAYLVNDDQRGTCLPMPIGQVSVVI